MQEILVPIDGPTLSKLSGVLMDFYEYNCSDEELQDFEDSSFYEKIMFLNEILEKRDPLMGPLMMQFLDQYTCFKIRLFFLFEGSGKTTTNVAQRIIPKIIVESFREGISHSFKAR